jgi:glycosyltransferase involved in cell wall biosynthesis
MDSAMRETPLVSVVMPVYNGEKYLAQAIDSILSQTYSPIEFIILNDGSTDSSVDIINGYADSRITLVNSYVRQGIVCQLNKGIDLAKGKYIARMDADDVCVHTRIATQVQFLENNPAVGVCGSWYSEIGSKKVINYSTDNQNIKIDLLSFCAFAHPTVMLRKCVLIDNGIRYEQEYTHCEDYRLWVVLSRVTEFGTVGKMLLYYRKHTGQISEIKKKIQEEKSELLKKEQFEYVLGHAIDEQQIKMIALTFREGIPINASDFEGIQELFKQLHDANGLRKVYAERFFNEFLLSTFIRTTYRLQDKNSLSLILHAAYVKMFSFKMKTRYYVKAVSNHVGRIFRT